MDSYLPPQVTIKTQISEGICGEKEITYPLSKPISVSYKSDLQKALGGSAQLTHPTGFYWAGGEFEITNFDGELVVGITPGITSSDDLLNKARFAIGVCLPVSPFTSNQAPSAGGNTCLPQVVTVSIGFGTDGNLVWFSQHGYITNTKITFHPQHCDKGQPMRADISMSFMFNMGNKLTELPVAKNLERHLWVCK